MRNILTPLRTGVSRFLSWWGGELMGCLPKAMLRMSAGSRHRYIVSVEDTGLRLIETSSGNALADRTAPDVTIPKQQMLNRLADLDRSKAASAIGVRLQYGACFARRIELPAAAASDFARLLAMDFERATPFKSKDVHSAHYGEGTPAAPGKIWVRQLIVKRGAIDELKADIDALGLEVASVDCWSEDGSSALPVNFLEQDAATKPDGRAKWLAPKLLGATAALLAVSAVVILLNRYETALRDLQAQTMVLKTKAQNVRDTLARSQTAFAEIADLYRLRSANVSRAAALEELTRLLPDTAWVTDLKMDGATVDISGLASSAATLVPILERSALFVDATPTAPLMFDQLEDKDRFSIRVRIRNSARTGSATLQEPAR